MPFVQSFAEFAARHGKGYFVTAAQVLWPTGAFWQLNEPRKYANHHDPGEGFDAPTNPLDVARRQRVFYSLRLERMEAEFEQLKAYVEQQIDFHAQNVGPPPNEDDLRQLRRLRRNILKDRQELERVERELDALDPERHERERRVAALERMRTEHAQQAAKLRNEVRSLTI